MSKIVSEIRESLRPDRLLPSIVAGVVAGILAITFMFSYSAVMFTEDLAIYVPRATGGMLFGGVVIAVMVSLFGAIRGAVALPQDNPTAIIAVISVLLNLTALESAFGEDIDMNRELKTASIANLGASLGGGLIGYHYVSLSTLGYRMKGDSRIVGLVVAAMCFGALTVGAGALSYFPRFILGGLVMFIGLSFLYDWVVQSWLKLSKSDFSIIMLILVVVETVGFLEAVAVGITAAVVLFVINYSRINVVRHAFSGADLHANIERPNAQRQVLRQQGGKTLILKLQGFIFFATSNGLLKTVQQKMEAASEPLSYLVIDFAHVTGLDSSALHGFVKIKQKAADHGILLVLCGLNSEVLRIFKGEKFADGDAVIDEMFDDLDQALECCETRILESAAMDPNPEHHPIDDLLAGMFKTIRRKERFKAALVKRELKKGEFLFHKHDEENALYFVERGDFTVNLEGEGGRGYRLRRIGSRTIVGVANFFRHGAHDALVSVQAETDGTVFYALTREMHEALRRDAPEVIAEFQADVLHFLSDRVADNLNVMEAVLRADE